MSQHDSVCWFVFCCFSQQRTVHVVHTLSYRDCLAWSINLAYSFSYHNMIVLFPLKVHLLATKILLPNYLEIILPRVEYNLNIAPYLPIGHQFYISLFSELNKKETHHVTLASHWPGRNQSHCICPTLHLFILHTPIYHIYTYLSYIHLI